VSIRMLNVCTLLAKPRLRLRPSSQPIVPACSGGSRFDAVVAGQVGGSSDGGDHVVERMPSLKAGSSHSTARSPRPATGRRGHHAAQPSEPGRPARSHS